MILQSLVSYYEALLEKGEIARPGWAKVRVQYALEIDESGELLSVLPLESVGEKNKPIPRYFTLPTPIKRSGVNAPANFLCDNAQYCLGLENGGPSKKALNCFSLFVQAHKRRLAAVNTNCAKALLAFLQAWNPYEAKNKICIKDNYESIVRGGNFIFVLRSGEYIHEDPEIKRICEVPESDENEVIGRCLATGKTMAIARIHNSVKGIRTNKMAPNGWTLVGFDKDAFCSYGKNQSYNAPVSKYAAFAYTTALNHLLVDRDHVKLIGDTTVVFWADGGEPQYQDACGCFLDGESVTNNDIKGVIRALSQGENAVWNALPLDPDNSFFVLGLSPNAARISVRFFLRDSFGHFVTHIKEHNERLEIVRPSFDKEENQPLWRLLRETVNPNTKDKSASPQLAGDTLRAILTGARYPATLYQQTMLRIRAEHNVTRGKAAIIKAYLIRNASNDQIKEAATMALNEQSNLTPYLLGRLFSILENIQTSSGGASTVKDRYFNSACSTPASVFPLLLKLKNSHAKVLKRDKPGLYINLERQLVEIIGRLPECFPVHLTLDEQGAFILGYYHETQKRYEKKNTEENMEENENV